MGLTAECSNPRGDTFTNFHGSTQFCHTSSHFRSPTRNAQFCLEPTGRRSLTGVALRSLTPSLSSFPSGLLLGTLPLLRPLWASPTFSLSNPPTGTPSIGPTRHKRTNLVFSTSLFSNPSKISLTLHLAAHLFIKTCRPHRDTPHIALRHRYTLLHALNRHN